MANTQLVEQFPIEIHLVDSNKRCMCLVIYIVVVQFHFIGTCMRNPSYVSSIESCLLAEHSSEMQMSRETTRSESNEEKRIF